MAKALLKVQLLLLGVVLLAAAPASAMKLPPGFQARVLPLPKATSPTYSNGLQMPTTLDFAPDGKLFVAQRNGRVLEFDTIEDSTPTLVLSILDEVMAQGDRGILGMKLDPDYPSEPYIYLSYTYDAPIGGDSADSTHGHLEDGSDECVEERTSGDCLVSGRLARVELDPGTSVAVGGAIEPPQQVLVNSWCQQILSHSVGDIEFDDEGALLMTGGDGASWGSSDYGHHGNWCNDPFDPDQGVYEGGSLRAQDVRTPETAADPTDYSGSMIRVDRKTGAAMPENPLALAPLIEGKPDEGAKRIVAFGLRNPYRFTLHPETGDVYVGDVGQDFWEEIDVVDLPGTAGEATNFGWPCFEGGTGGNLVMQRWEDLEKPLCESLYDEPAQVTAPFFAYSHPKTPGYDGRLFTGDECSPERGSAVAGLAFYDPAGVPAENVLPSDHHGALFFTDAARGCIWTMLEGTDGALDPTTVDNFWLPQGGDPLFTPVDIVEGSDGAFYVPNFSGDSITQIRYFAGNQAPTAELSVDKTFGPAPLTVHFDASATTDPDPGDNLHFAWDLDGDGQFDDGAAATAEREYTAEENTTVRLRVSDDFFHTETLEETIYPGDLGPPVVTIEAPDPGLKWTVGKKIDYAASATDPDGDEFGSTEQPLNALWEFTLLHCPSECHPHVITSADELTGSFFPPDHEYPTHLRLEFTATDSRGMSTTESVEVYPHEVQVGVESDPAGIPLSIAGRSEVEPFSETMLAGGKIDVSAPATAILDGTEYQFVSWSDGGDRIHDVTSEEDVELVARFEPKPIEEKPGPESVTPLLPAEPGSASLRLASRPRGVRLQIGTTRKKAPFSTVAPIGRTTLLAPKKFRIRGKTLRFKRWMAAGRSLGTSPRRGITVAGNAGYLAIYGR